MNKKSFYRNINIALGTILILHVIETMVMYWLFSENKPLEEIIINSKNTLLSFLIVIVVVYIAIIIYQTVKLNKSVKIFSHIFEEYRVGNYSYNVLEQKDRLEKEFHPLITKLDKVFSNVQKFDKLKETKIFTHHSRIKAILNLINEGGMIIDNSGDIIYINDIMKSNFSFLEEEINVLENVYDKHFEESMKRYIRDVLSEQMRKDSYRFFYKDSDEEITIKSHMYKNSKGEIGGAVFVVSGLTNLPSKKKSLIKKIS